ncbi:MAG: sn-glycerol-3-phosphate ABC transporter permease UgpA [Geminicoccaceae bacterium]
MSKSVIFGNRWLPYLLLLPQLLVLLVFFFWPAAQALIQSFMISDAFGNTSTFVWFQNFTRLFKSQEYWDSIRVTIVFSVLTGGLALSLGLLFAIFADRVIRGTAFYKTLLIWPYAVAPATAGALWLFLLNPTMGVLAYLMNKQLGIHWDPTLNRADGMALVVLASAWKQISYNFVFFLAGMQSIPRSIIEAAAIDGARPVKRLFTIVLPLLSPTTFFLLVMNSVYAFFDTFGIIDTTTDGGPGGATSILVYKVYRDGFVGLDLGSSSAQSVILMGFVIALTFVQFRYVERMVHYKS